MQKKIIALAVAGLMSGAAFAQSNVTVYGVADTFFGRQSSDQAAGTRDAKRNVVDSGVLAGSRIGFRGTEDLGNGLKALFTLEYGISTDANNAGPMNARQSFVGLSGNFGTVVGGKLYTPGYNIMNKFNPNIGGGQLSSIAGLQTAAGATAHVGEAGRLNNTLAYVSPNFSGVTLTGAYSTHTENVTTNTAKNNSRIWAFGADYDNGPLAVSYAHHNIRNAATPAGNAVLSLTTVSNVIGAACGDGTVVKAVSGTGPAMGVCSTTAAAGNETKQKENVFGASYDFGVAKLLGTYQTVKATEQGVAGSDKFKIWSLGGMIPVMGNGSVRVAYSKLSDDSTGVNAADAKSYHLGYVHSMSKRTSLYGGYTKYSNDRNADARNGGLTAPANGGDTSVYGAGLSHAF